MESNAAYIPQDRLLAIARNVTLPQQTRGCVLFADISGFTPLTESFEKRFGPRRGGEELTRILNDVYASLIGEVDKRRGSVIGFAGDAITCWFDGDDGERSIASALAMQKGMSRFSKIPVGNGETIALGLKAAISGGDVNRFVVGSESIQRVDVLAGNPVYQVALIEKLAAAGEALIDESIFQTLRHKLTVKEKRTSEKYSINAYAIDSIADEPASAPWPNVSELGVSGNDLTPWLIAPVRERIDSGLGEFFTELRPATAMFVKFDGIDYENDEDAKDALDEFFSLAQKVVTGFGGIIHQLTLGDKGSFLYAAFGAPVSHEDDTRRAMAAALNLQSLTASLSKIHPLKIGIARGSTRTGAYGAPTRRTYGVLGDIVNMAARFMGVAEPGEILVSKAAFLETEKDFICDALPPVQLKGKSAQVPVYRLVKASGERTQARQSAYTLPLVGRVEEQKRLFSLIEKSRTGRGQLIALIGDAGVGKTRLVEAASEIATTKGVHVMYGECQSFGASTFYTPWWSVWRELFGIKAGTPPEDAVATLTSHLEKIDSRLLERLPLLGSVLNIQLPDNELTKSFDAKLRRASLESLLVECLRYASLQTPCMIIMEDVHAIDPDSKRLLSTLIQAIARLPVTLLVAFRPDTQSEALLPEEIELDYTNLIRLEEFNSSESEAFIRLKHAKLFGTAAKLSPHIVQQISERTGRNPFYIEETLNWIHQERIELDNQTGLDAIELPASLHSLVLSRMDQLQEKLRVTLKVASVVGRLFRAAIVWGSYPDLGGKQNVLNSLDKLTQLEFTERELKHPELVYLFRHVVMQEVAYESLPSKLRTKLHEAIGDFVERSLSVDTNEALDLLAFHFGRSDDESRKLKYLLLAADAASRVYSSAAAANYYKAALPLLSEYNQIPILRRLGRVLEIASDWDGAMTIYQQALELSGKHNRPKNVAYSKLSIGEILLKKGNFEHAAAWLRDAQADFESIDFEEGIGQALHSLGNLSAQSGDYSQAQDLYNRSIVIRRNLGDDAKVSSLMSNLGIIARFQGELEKALELQEESLAIRRRLNDAWAVGNSLNNLGMAKRYMGNYDAAKENLTEALSVLKKVGDRNEISNTLISLAEVSLDQKDTVASEAYLKESIQLAREVGNLRAIAYIFEGFATTESVNKNFARSVTLIGAAKNLRQSIGAPLPEKDQSSIDAIVSTARVHLGTEETERLAKVGSSMPLSEALDFSTSSQTANTSG